MSNLTKVERAHKRRELFLEVHGKSRLVEIRLLYFMFRDGDWKRLGFETFKAFTEAPRDSGGLDISREWASELIQTYKKYVVELGLNENILIDNSPRKLYYLKGEATKGNIDDVLARASHMTLADLQKERSGIEEATCKHKWILWKRCERCKVWEKKDAP